MHCTGKGRTMAFVKVSHLKPDMLVCSDLKDRNGRLLVAAGTKLTEQHIRIIKIWGVVEADVGGASEQDAVSLPDEASKPVILKAAEEAVTEQFRFNDRDNAIISELFTIGCRWKSAQMARNNSAGNAPQVPLGHGRAAPERGDAPDGKPRTFQDKPFDHIRKLIRQDIKLTTLPAIYTRINEAIMRPHSSSSDIADLISKDTSLAARLLKLVDSSFYGYPSRIGSLSRAVSIVGTNQLSMLAFGIDVAGAFKNIPSTYINMDSFWRHSIACGIIARLIAATKNIQNTERLFVAGMLHDIGRLVVYHYMPQCSVEILERARDTCSLLCRVEKEYLGGDHAEIGGMLLQIWKLPQSLENAVRYHNMPRESQNGLEPAIVHIADVTAKAIGVGSSGDYFVPQLDGGAWKQVGLSVNGLEPIVDQTDHQLEETFRLFFK